MADIDIHEKTLKVYEDKMDKSLEVLKSDLRTVRAGRANPHEIGRASCRERV